MLLGVSGGADSMALLHATLELRQRGAGRVVVAHFHHGLRADAADSDAQFVADTCRDWELPFILGRAEPENSVGNEETARDQRHAFLRSTAESCGARQVILAHTRDDQVETILHRILRGTALHGLTGIPEVRTYSEAVTVVRPLLHVSRSCVLDYLQQRQQTYREDATNLDRNFTRNRIRHELLPQLRQEYNAQVDESLLRLGQQARAMQGWASEEVNRLIESAVCFPEPGVVRIRRNAISAETPEWLLRELFTHLWRGGAWPLKNMTYAHWQSLAVWLRSGQPRKLQMPGPITAACDDRLAVLRDDRQIELP